MPVNRVENGARKVLLKVVKTMLTDLRLPVSPFLVLSHSVMETPCLRVTAVRSKCDQGNFARKGLRSESC